MRKYLLLAIVIGFFLWIGTRLMGRPNDAPLSSGVPTQMSNPSVSGTIVALNGKKYRVNVQRINTQSLALVPNFTLKNTSQKIMDENQCAYGINGGFYTTDYQPLGYFYTDGKYWSKTSHPNSLFNGYLIKTASGELTISENPPVDIKNIQFSFQTGPLITPSSMLKLQTDESARRILIAKTDKNDFYFLAITSEDNTNSGPLLSDLPQIIQLLNDELRTMNYELILNLDGGSASAFYSEDGVSLGEITPVGSFLCGG